MEISDITSDVEYQLIGMSAGDGEDYKIFALDLGEIFIKTPQGEFFKLAIDKVDAETVDFIGNGDWS